MMAKGTSIKEIFGVERLVGTYTPRGVARCEKCRKRLSYDYGSIRWQCREKNLCSEHEAEEFVEKVSVKSRHERVRARDRSY